MPPLDNVFLHPGQIHVNAHPACVSTVCGPGAVVCLWDPDRRWGGICHYVVSASPGRVRPTPQFAEVALQTTLRMLRDLGTPERCLRAKVFGGATPAGMPELRDIAGQNVDFIHVQLAERGIPILREDVGGDRGRKIVYYTQSNSAKVLRTDRLRDRDWWAPLDAVRRMRP